MKLKTPGSEGREKQDRVQSPLLPTAPPGPTFLPFARCLGEGPGHCAAPIHPPSPPPSTGRPEGLGTYHKVSAPAEHLGRHATVRTGGVLGVQDVTAKGTGWLVRPYPQPSCLPLPQVLSGSPGLFPTWAPTAPITRHFPREPGSLNPCGRKAAASPTQTRVLLLPLSQRLPHTWAQPQGPCMVRGSGAQRQTG